MNILVWGCRGVIVPCVRSGNRIYVSCGNVSLASLDQIMLKFASIFGFEGVQEIFSSLVRLS